MDVTVCAEKIEKVNQRIAQLRQRAHGLPAPHRELLDSALFELDGVIAELHAAEQEIYEQRARLEDSHRQSEAEQLRYRNLFESMPDAYLVTDVEGNVLEANRATTSLLNIELSALLGQPFVQCVAPKDTPTFLHALEQAHEPGRLREYNLHVQRFQGASVDVRLKGEAVRDQAGAVIALGWLLHDITERKQAESELRHRNEIFQSIFDHIPVMIQFFSADGRIQLVNRTWERTLGWTLEEIQTHNLDIFAEFYPDPRARQRVLNFIAAATGEWADFKTRVRDGRLIDTTFANIRLSDGTTIGIGQDITERKRAEAALRLYTERLEMLHQIDRAILAARSPMEIAQVALRHLWAMVPCRRGGVAVIGPGGRQVITLVIDSNGDIHVESGIQLSPDLFGGDGATGANETSHASGFAPEPLILSDPPPVVQALLADGVRSYMILPLISQGAMIGALSLGAGKAHAFTSAHLDIAREVADSVAIAIQQARLSEQISDGRERLRSLTRRLVETQETERRQLAQELHDQVGQTLTALNISLRIARDQLSAESAAKVGVRLDQSARLTEETMEQIRGVMAALRPAVLDDYGLAAALRWYVQQFSERTGLAVALHLDAATETLRLEPRAETALFRVVQEALTNVVKHARSTRAAVVLEADEQAMRLTVADRGVGFDPAEPPQVSEHHSLGLIGMRERLEAVGGRLHLESAPGQGTRIIAEVQR